MSLIYINEDLVTGLNDGSSEANAYQTWTILVANAFTLTEDTDIIVRSNGTFSRSNRYINAADGWNNGGFLLRVIGVDGCTLFYSSQFNRVLQTDIDNIEIWNINIDGGNTGVDLLGSNQKAINCTFRNSGSAGLQKAGDTNVAGKCFVINCISYSNDDVGFTVTGFRHLEVINCYSGGNTGVDYVEELNGVLTITTSASSDTSGSVGLQNVPYDTTTFTNITSGSENFHLVTGSDLIDTGTITSYLTDQAGDIWSIPREIGLFNFVSGGATAYTIEIETGNIIANGNDIGLSLNRITGLETGNILADGHDIIQKVSRRSAFETGNIIVDGKDINLIKGTSLSIETGNIIATGHSVSLKNASILILETGHIVVTGYDIGLGNQKNYVLEVDTGHILVDGKDIGLLRESEIGINTGHIILTGYDIDLVWSEDTGITGRITISMNLIKPSITMEVIKPSISMSVIKPSITMELDQCQ